MKYRVRRAVHPPDLTAVFESEAWSAAEIVHIDQFHPKSSSHRPETRAKCLWSDRSLHLIFQVHDRYIRSIRTCFQDLVSKDSCVEFFIQPNGGGGYFNFEMNCGGALLLYYIEDPTRIVDAPFRKYSILPTELGEKVRIRSTMAAIVEPEITSPRCWELSLAIPFQVMELYVGPIAALGGSVWRGNFFKCADESSHPHWASWVPIGEALRFHQPERFGELLFQD